MANEILLETGTNEVEILEYYIQGQSMGINVAKVAQIVPFEQDKLTKVPDNDPAIIGRFLWQDNTIPLIDLRQILHPDNELSNKAEKPIVLVTEFNRTINGFLCDAVNRIHRISWEEIDPLSSFLDTHSSIVIGSINLKNNDILMVDFEHIISELYPETKMGYGEDAPLEADELLARRKQMKIVFAEDSPFIRTTILKLLDKSGYSQVASFDNGSKAFKYIGKMNSQAAESNQDVSELLSLVISDIEMPKMDGLTLCKNIKIDLGLEKTPVIIFSSLINEQMIHKCKEVKADGYTTKPQINELIEMMDKNLGLAS